LRADITAPRVARASCAQLGSARGWSADRPRTNLSRSNNRFLRRGARARCPL
jgi:hypothetical protein